MNSPSISLLIVLISFSMYLIQEGQTLMLCILAPAYGSQKKTQIVNYLLPSWDGNQTWLVLSIALLYGAFPGFFAQFLSKYYLFFISLVILLILRGACIEFYAKSTKARSYWLTGLAFASLGVFVLLILLLAILLESELSVGLVISISLFLICFNLTQAYCFLYRPTRLNRLLCILSLLITSSLLVGHFHLSIAEHVSLMLIFLLRLSLLTVFLIKTLRSSPPKWLGQLLMVILFISNAYFIVFPRMPITSKSYLAAMGYSMDNPSYLVINWASIILLPMIAYALAKMKQLFAQNQEELS